MHFQEAKKSPGQNVKRVFKLATTTMVFLILLNTFYSHMSSQITNQNMIKTLDFVSEASAQKPTTEKHANSSSDLLNSMAKICSRVKENNLTGLRHYLVDHDHKLLYCWIHKSASTSWIALFSHLAHRKHVRQYYREIPVLSVKSTEELMRISRDESYNKFMIVRHPFARLVSAYRDRIEDNTKFTSQAYIYAASILRRTRPLFRKPRHAMFLNGRKSRLIDVPTFKEFITWLVTTDPQKYDEHWNLYGDHCSPCAIKFNNVYKLETMKQNHLHGVDSLKHLQQSRGGSTTFEVSCRYFSQLTPNLIESLYKIYKVDFDMFGYSADEYEKCVNDPHEP